LRINYFACCLFRTLFFTIFLFPLSALSPYFFIRACDRHSSFDLALGSFNHQKNSLSSGMQGFADSPPNVGVDETAVIELAQRPGLTMRRLLRERATSLK
jgi:hypothetical protein